MSFLAIDAQKNLFTLQRNQLQFEQTQVQREAQYLAEEMAAYEEQNPDADLDSDYIYAYMEAEDEYLETKQDSLSSQIELIDQSISSLQTMVQNNIKSTCGLNLIGG